MINLSTIYNYWPHCRVAAVAGVTPDATAKTLTIVGAKTVETEPTTLDSQGLFSYLMSWTTADGVGVLTVLASNNWDSVRRTGDFFDITSAFQAITPVAGTNSFALINADGAGWGAVKVVYTQASGTVVMKSSFAAKGR